MKTENAKRLAVAGILVILGLARAASNIPSAAIGKLTGKTAGAAVDVSHAADAARAASKEAQAASDASAGSKAVKWADRAGKADTAAGVVEAVAVGSSGDEETESPKQ